MRRSVPSALNTSCWSATWAVRKVMSAHWAPAGSDGAVQLSEPAVVPPKNPAVSVPVTCDVRLIAESGSSVVRPVASQGELVHR